ncbi:S8 family serine peptidase [Streptomyces sp. NPDC094032]|uniref:S8 family serine peptidase n=1 Tax=Streptomyces sp. NPDC094032 TaxID=3155308 RepID=UPI0033252BC9
MTRARGAGRTAVVVTRTALTAALACATLLGSPGPATARASEAGTRPGASGTAPADSFPTLTQRLSGNREACRRSSGRTTDRTPWPQAYLRPDRVWPLTEGRGVTVAVVGSGVDDAAGVLGGRLTRAPRQFDAGPAADCVGHGTFVAGLVAAARTPGTGFAGIAPGARVLAVGVTDRAGNTTPDLLARGIRVAADRGARVIAVVAVAGQDDARLRAAVRYATGKGALLIAPVTPDGQGRGVTAYPAAYPEVLSVAATGPAGLPAGESGVPPGRVDLTAPGVSVMGTGPGGRGYFTASGPSYAVAFVAGSAALVSGYRPELTGGRLAYRLRATAARPGGGVPDVFQGYGAVDPVAAVTTVLPEERGVGGRTLPPAPPAAMPAGPGASAAGTGLLVAGAAAGGTAVVAAAAFVVPAGRRRGWRPGRRAV